MTDYPDFQQPQAIANLIGALGLATTTLQATANQIATAIGGVGLNAQVPVKISSGGPHAAGAAWGPDAAVVYPIGAAYEILITPQTGNNIFITDITVQHLDSTNAVVFTENFTVSNLALNGLTGGTAGGPGVIIRGNLHGPKLQLSGLTITQANMNTILGTAAFTVTGINITYYSQAFSIPATRPKVAPLIGAGYLAFMLNKTINAGATFNYGAIPCYSGTVHLFYRAATSNSSLFPSISSFSVLNGTTQIYTMQPPVAVAQPLGPVRFALDQLFHTLSFVNPSAANGVMNASLVMEDFI